MLEFYFACFFWALSFVLSFALNLARNQFFIIHRNFDPERDVDSFLIKIHKVTASRDFLESVSIGRTLWMTLLAICTLYLENYFGLAIFGAPQDWWLFLLNALLLTALVYWFTVFIPSLLGQLKPYSLASFGYFFYSIHQFLFAWQARFVAWIYEKSLQKGGYDSKLSFLTEAEKKQLTSDVKSESGESLLAEEQKMIRNIFEFGDTPVQEIMTPRMSIVAVSISSTLQEVSQLINEEKHTRTPVYKEDLDHIVGFIHSKDILKWLTENETQEFHISKILRKAHLVPNQKPIDELLREFRAERSHLAIVVDEYGNTVGLVSMEDILEEIVGEIYDEDDDPDLDLEQVGNHRWMVDPSISLTDLEEAIGVEIPLDEDEDADSLGGLILLKFGRVPGKGQKIDIGPARVRIVKASAQRLLRVLVEVKTTQALIKS